MIQIPQSQIGFINFIVEPLFQVLGDMMQKLLDSSGIVDEEEEGRVKRVVAGKPWETHILENRNKWTEMLK